MQSVVTLTTLAVSSIFSSKWIACSYGKPLRCVILGFAVKSFYNCSYSHRETFFLDVSCRTVLISEWPTGFDCCQWKLRLFSLVNAVYSVLQGDCLLPWVRSMIWALRNSWARCLLASIWRSLAALFFYRRRNTPRFFLFFSKGFCLVFWDSLIQRTLCFWEVWFNILAR